MNTKKTIEKKDVWVLVSAFNEGKYISQVLKKIKKYTKNIIVIDDGSSDDTASLASKEIFNVLSHQINLGKGAAMKTGSEYAFNYLGAEAVIFMDSDDQHNPSELNLFFDKLKVGHELILGVRNFKNKMPKYKIFVNTITSIIVKLIFGLFIPDIPSGFKAMSKNIYQQCKWNSSNYEVELEIAVRIAKLRLPFQTVSISTLYHDHNKGMTLIDAMLMMIKILKWSINL